MRFTFNTIKDQSAGIYKEKGSKFIGYCFPVKTVKKIKEHIETLKAEHHKARHHCYAWRLGTDNNKFRANDDGEPSGMAGRPILGQIDSFGLTNVLVVVVRYFGGTLLGASGLIRSYKNAAAAALGNTEIDEDRLMSLFQLKFQYSLMNKVMAALKVENVNFINQTFELDCEVTIEVKTEHEPAFRAKFKPIEGLKIRFVGIR